MTTVKMVDAAFGLVNEPASATSVVIYVTGFHDSPFKHS